MALWCFLTAAQVCRLYTTTAAAPTWPSHVDYTNDPWEDAKPLFNKFQITILYRKIETWPPMISRK